MTEKKKRGRPPGSGKKNKEPSIETPNKEEVKHNQVTYQDVVDLGVAMAKESFKKSAAKFKRDKEGRLDIHNPVEAAALARALYCESSQKEVPFPSDWDKMGKIDRLKWLTANRTK